MPPHISFISPMVHTPPAIICVEHSYLFTSLVRALGIPARELNIAFATHIRKVEGTYTLGYYYQEAAAQAFYDHEWHLYDPFLERQTFASYVDHYWSYRAWYAYDARGRGSGGTEIGSDGKFGHNFWLDSSGTGPPKARDQWKFLKQDTKKGVAVSLLPGEGEFRIIATSANGARTGCSSSGDIYREIPHSLYYRRRSISDLSSEHTDYPDIIFLSLNRGTTYRIKIHIQGGDTRLLTPQNSPTDHQYRLIFLQTRPSKQNLIEYSRIGSLTEKQPRIYTFKMKPDGSLEIPLK